MSRTSTTLCARLLCGAAAITFISSGVANAQAAEFNIASQPLELAINAFSEQSRLPVLLKPELADAKVAQGVSGTLEPEAALTQMLRGTNLTFRRNGDAFLIVQQGEGGSSPQSAGAGGDGNAVEALIVTAQKKEEQIQDVPIAISAFTQKSLDAQKLEGGFDLLKAIPNVTFSKTNFTGYNFSIRGIGTKAVSATTDPGVAVAFNNSTLIVNRLFEQEYFDVERVEVLRGPQGTLYGRNATAGVINVISAKPRLMEFEGDIELEGGNYNAQRVRGMINIPVGDTFAIRAAGSMTKRDGFGVNLLDGSDVDNRDLWSTRLTLAWEPIEQVRTTLLWEHFEEDDERVRTSKQLCHHDPGPDFVGSVNVDEERLSNFIRGSLTQGCLPGSLYDEGAFGTPNGNALPFVGATRSVAGGSLGGNPNFYNPDAEACDDMRGVGNMPFLDVCTYDPYGNRRQSTDLRAIESTIEPAYRAKSDIFDLSIDIDLTNSLTITSQTVYAKDELYSTQDFNRFHTLPVFNDSAAACGNSFWLWGFGAPCDPGTAGSADVTPGGVYTDPQLGPSDTIVGQDISQSESSQFNQEFRLQSNFDGDLNFSIGANYTRFRTINDYYVFFNLLTFVQEVLPVVGGYMDPNPLEEINGEGHNYFRSANPYKLSSSALFGELYWQATETLKVTAGARMTWDRKTFTPIPSQTLLGDYRNNPLVPPGGGPETCFDQLFCQVAGTAPGGRGYPAEADIVQEWTEPTGRLGFDWKPELGFTDETMVYAFVAHGYKGGGANPPGIAWPSGMFIEDAQGVEAGATFLPEFVDAFEVGAKNTLLEGALILNGGAFFYDYTDYQVSKIVDRSAANENFDAKVWGAELEWIYSPTRSLRFNGTFGALRTEIAEGEQSIDLMDRTQGNPDYIVIKPFLTQSSNCIAPVAFVEAAMLDAPDDYNEFMTFCPGGNVDGRTYWEGRTSSIPIPGTGGQFLTTENTPNFGAGIFADIGGHELPNAPHWTASIGGQYRMPLPGGWDATLRGDFYWQSQSYARVYNTQYDKLRAWTNTNLSLWVENPDWGVTAEVYVKNVFDETPITDAFLNSDDTALTTNIFTLDPRLVGVSVRKTF